MAGSISIAEAELATTVRQMRAAPCRALRDTIVPIKNNFKTIKQVIIHIENRSIARGVSHSDHLNTGKVVPIYKRREYNRPISHIPISVAPRQSSFKSRSPNN